jgi:hypothetical protein
MTLGAAHPPPSIPRQSVLNVISLEFSGTPLEPLVRSPRVVRQLDWIDTVWPRARHQAGQYPRVQLYCLMSVGGSWTGAPRIAAIVVVVVEWGGGGEGTCCHCWCD